MWIKSSTIESLKLQELKYLALENCVDLHTICKIVNCKYRSEFKLIIKKYLDDRKGL